MKKLEGLTLREVLEKWVEGAKFARPHSDSMIESDPKLFIFKGSHVVSDDWILELPDEKPMTDEEIIDEATKMSVDHCWLDSDMKKAIKLARENERLRYQRLISVLNDFTSKFTNTEHSFKLAEICKDINNINRILEEVENEKTDRTDFERST